MITHTLQGTRVPALGFGTYQITGDACREAVADALRIGYRHLDTAQVYDNEAEVGRGLADAGVDRDAFFLTTKLWPDGLTPANTRQRAEASLRRLGTDYVDLLLIHWPFDDLDIEGVLEVMHTLQQEGKTRHLGVSNFTPTLLRRALAAAPVFCNQVEYHPFLAQDRLRAMAQAHDLLLTAYSPVARGKVADDDTLRELAETHGKTPFQVTLRWLLQQPHVAAIPKAASARHRRANFDVFDFALTDDEMARIDALAHGRRLVDPAFAPSWE